MSSLSLFPSFLPPPPSPLRNYYRSSQTLRHVKSVKTISQGAVVLAGGLDHVQEGGLPLGEDSRLDNSPTPSVAGSLLLCSFAPSPLSSCPGPQFFFVSVVPSRWKWLVTSYPSPWWWDFEGVQGDILKRDEGASNDRGLQMCRREGRQISRGWEGVEVVGEIRSAFFTIQENLRNEVAFVVCSVTLCSLWE